MGTVRDPAFWRRFSVAIHQDEEQKGYTASESASTSSAGSRPPLKTNDSWLARERKKRSRRNLICWIFWLAFFAFVAGIVGLVVWLQSSGVLKKIHIG